MQETQEIQLQPLGQKDPLEKEMETCSSILARIIPWTQEPGRLQSMGSQRVGHDQVIEHAHIINLKTNERQGDWKELAESLNLAPPLQTVSSIKSATYSYKQLCF